MASYDVLSRSAHTVAGKLGRAPIGVVLGSGMSEVLDNLERQRVLDYSQIPGLGEPSTIGHRGALLRGYCGETPVLALCGRIHMYEGKPMEEVAAPVRLLSLLGVHTLVVTSAVGSTDPDLPPGHLCLIEDHMNLSGRNVLAGAHEPKFGARFPDLTQAYDPEFLDLFEEVARLGSIPVGRGVLAQFLGPTYETPAEVRMARQLGARVVSMSMVPDVITARQRHMRVVGVAAVTNMAAGLAGGVLKHDDVLVASARNASNLQTLLTGALPRLAELETSTT